MKEKIFKPADIPQYDPERPVSNLMFLIWSIRDDLKKAYDIRTPAGQKDFLNWYKSAAFLEYGLNTEEKTAASDMPMHESYRRLNGIWKKIAFWIPATIKNRIKGLLYKLLLAIIQQRNYATPTTDLNHGRHKTIPGANLIGYAFTESGMGEHVRMSAASFSTTEIPFHVIDFNHGVKSRQLANLEHGELAEKNIHQVNIFHINADQILSAITQKGAEFFSNRFNICYPFWELSQFPKEWVPALRLMDEIWAPTRHVQQAIAEAMDAEVHHMPIAVTLPPFNELPRGHFGLPEDTFVFFCAFDFLSYIHRKNPWAAVQAFVEAFPVKGAQVNLVIKVMNARNEDPEWHKLKHLAQTDSRIILINQTLAKQELLALINVCDSYVSLHRAEGFGLGPVEAMLLEKPAIVTNYSGNTDYSHKDHSCLVDYTLIPIERNQYPFGKGKVWADPSIEHAAWYMKQLYEKPEWGKALGQKARGYILEYHAPDRCGNQYKNRLEALGMV